MIWLVLAPVHGSRNPYDLAGLRRYAGHDGTWTANATPSWSRLHSPLPFGPVPPLDDLKQQQGVGPLSSTACLALSGLGGIHGVYGTLWDTLWAEWQTCSRSPFNTAWILGGNSGLWHETSHRERIREQLAGRGRMDIWW